MTLRASDQRLPGGSFSLLVQRLGYQALINLGVLENPLTREHTVDLQHAQTVLDDLRMIREKTTGNLEYEELAHLEQVIEELERRVQELGGPEPR